MVEKRVRGILKRQNIVKSDKEWDAVATCRDKRNIKRILIDKTQTKWVYASV